MDSNDQGFNNRRRTRLFNKKVKLLKELDLVNSEIASCSNRATADLPQETLVRTLYSGACHSLTPRRSGLAHIYPHRNYRITERDGGSVGYWIAVEEEIDGRWLTIDNDWNRTHCLEDAVTSMAIKHTDCRAETKLSPEGLEDRRLEWVNKTREEARELLKLEQNWNDYGAPPPGFLTFYFLCRLLQPAADLGLSWGHVSPSGEGGMALIWRTETKYADIEYLNTGEVLAVVKNNNSPSEAWELKYYEVDKVNGGIRLIADLHELERQALERIKNFFAKG